MYAVAHSSNDIVLGATRLASTRDASRSAIGSFPARRISRAARARARAPASGTSLRGPRPIWRSRPATAYLKSQDFRGVRSEPCVTCKQRPPPSLCMPGFFEGLDPPVRQTVDGTGHAYLRFYPRSTPEL